ncbi:Unknown protein, partial [Striga hermonthica]
PHPHSVQKKPAQQEAVAKDLAQTSLIDMGIQSQETPHHERQRKSDDPNHTNPIPFFQKGNQQIDNDDSEQQTCHHYDLGYEHSKGNQKPTNETRKETNHKESHMVCELDTAKARTCILESGVKLAKQDELENAQTIEFLRTELFSTQKLLAERTQEIVLLKNEVDWMMNEHASMESKLKANSVELNRTTEVVRKLNKEKADLNELLSLGRQHGDLTGIGYTGREDIPQCSTGSSNAKHTRLGFGDKPGVGGLNLHGRPSRNVFDRFVKSTVSKPPSPQSPLKVHSPKQKSVIKTHHNFVTICHYCG